MRLSTFLSKIGQGFFWKTLQSWNSTGKRGVAGIMKSRELGRSLGIGLEHISDAVSRRLTLLVVLLVLADFALAWFVAKSVPYTEIDWKAYMEEVSGVVVDHEFDYLNLRGDTGPLVYPAGFVWIYAVLHHATDSGARIDIAQGIFAGLHACVFGLTAAIYVRYFRDLESFASRGTTAPGPLIQAFSIIALLGSRRVLSIFVLRLFNDAVQVFLGLLAVWLFSGNKWALGCLLYSMSVSVKMNGLLYAPGVALLLFQALGPIQALLHLIGICGGFQVLVGLPFLLAAPASYVSKAFEFSRVFEYKWSVNGAFLAEASFLDPRLAGALVAVHVTVLLAFGHFKWSQDDRGLLALVSPCSPTRRETGFRTHLCHWMPWARSYGTRPLRASHVIETLFTCNFIGIVFARTLHYQFYVWYFFSLPLLLLCSTMPKAMAFCILIVIETVFNVYPPRHLTALALCTAHVALLSALWHAPSSSQDHFFQGGKSE